MYGTRRREPPKRRRAGGAKSGKRKATTNFAEEELLLEDQDPALSCSWKHRRMWATWKQQELALAKEKVAFLGICANELTPWYELIGRLTP
jgi:hypothetical protein